MRNVIEYQNLGFSTLEDYLNSDQMRSGGNFGANILPGSSGTVTLSLSKSKSAFLHHYLVLTAKQDGEARRVVVAGESEEGQVCFDLSKYAQALLQCPNWSIYAAMDDDKEFVMSRLRENGEALGVLPPPQVETAPAPVGQCAPELKRSGALGRLKGLFGAGKAKPISPPLEEPKAPEAYPPFVLWEDAKRLHDTGITSPDGAACLVLRTHPTTRRVNLIRLPRTEAKMRLSGRVLHRSSTAEGESPFTFSVVMAIYNVKPYLGEAVESILQQDIGFEAHVELILVDDGSTDGSGEICEGYKAKYPKNITVIHQANAGAAAARNAGKAAARGAYVNFLDADDKLSPNTLSAVARFLSSHQDEVDVAVVPIYLFEAKTGPYWQNYKFERGTRVINLWQEWTISNMNTAASFIRRELVERFSFDSALPNGEDLKYLLYVLLEKMQLGVVAEGAYWYRRRSAGGSLINTNYLKRSWYTDYFTHLPQELLDHCQKRFGFVPEFVQNSLMMDLQWRFHRQDRPEGLLSDEEWTIYKQTISRMVARIDDHVILAQRKLSPSRLMQVFTMKYGKAPDLFPSADDLHSVVNGSYLCAWSTLPVYVERVTLEKDLLTIDGWCNLPSPQIGKLQQYLFVDGDYYPCQPLLRHSQSVDSSFGPVQREYGFHGSMNVSPQHLGKPIRLISVVDSHPVAHSNYRYERSSPFYGRMEGQYLWGEDLCILPFKNCLRAVQGEERSVREKEFLAGVEKRVRSAAELTQSPGSSDLSREQYEQLLRLRSYALSCAKEKPVWLICDHLHSAGDRGEELFRCLMERKDCPAQVYYVLSKDSSDYSRLSALGPVLDYGSEEHLRCFLRADLVLYSQEREGVFSPFAGEYGGSALRRYYADLLGAQQYVFLHAAPSHEDPDSLDQDQKMARKYPRVELGEKDIPAIADALCTPSC